MLAGHSRAPRVASRRRRPSRRPVASGPARGDARQRPSPWRCSGSLIRPGPGPGPRGCDQRLGAAAPVCRRASDVTERAGGMSESESAPGSPPSSKHKPKIASRKRGAPAPSQASPATVGTRRLWGPDPARARGELEANLIRLPRSPWHQGAASDRHQSLQGHEQSSSEIVTVTPGPGQIVTVTPGPGQTDSDSG